MSSGTGLPGKGQLHTMGLEPTGEPTREPTGSLRGSLRGAYAEPTRNYAEPKRMEAVLL